MQRSLLTAALLLLPAGPLLAQNYTWDEISDLGIRFQKFDKLERLPLKLGEAEKWHKARYEPPGEGDRIHGKMGSFPWHLNVYEFQKADAAAPATGPDDSGKPAEPAARPAERVTFTTWVTTKEEGENRKFLVKGKAVPGKGKKLAHTWWEYVHEMPMSNGRESFKQPFYNWAAVYDFPDREIVLVCGIPLLKSGGKPQAKHETWAKTMLLSVRLAKEDDEAEDEVDAKRDLFADTDAKKAELEKAKDNIKDLGWWDYFTAPHYIVLYSWPADHAANFEKRRKSQQTAKSLADDMERMHSLYEEHYPPHDKMLHTYSVMRICSSLDEFQKYGGTGGGTVGWFNPGTKELVFFIAEQYQPGLTRAVAFHEGWHQYSDKYFNLEFKSELHRWFDEGTGDFFGSHTWNGRKWEYETSKMRKVPIKTIVNTKKFVPWREIVSWNKDKFYGNRASDYYAQGYSMVDFLRNGSKNRMRWDPTWENILDTYRATMLEQKDQKKAVEAAFQGVDWEKIEAAWLAWVKDY
jgi:hypothetical protein